MEEIANTLSPEDLFVMILQRAPYVLVAMIVCRSSLKFLKIILNHRQKIKLYSLEEGKSKRADERLKKSHYLDTLLSISIQIQENNSKHKIIKLLEDREQIKIKTDSIMAKGKKRKKTTKREKPEDWEVYNKNNLKEQ